MKSYTFTLTEPELFVLKELKPDLEKKLGTYRLSYEGDDALRSFLKKIDFIYQQGGNDDDVVPNKG